VIAIACANCGVTFGITDTLNDLRRKDHDTFYCPNGHANHFPAPVETEEQKQIKQLERVAERRSESYRQLHVTLDDWKQAARICPICEERVTQAQFIETIRSKVAEHLRNEHGARARLRSITQKASA
jgi:hypothetical protein